MSIAAGSAPAAQFAAAEQAYLVGDRVAAEWRCRALLGQDPTHVEALHLLGVVCLDQERLPDAIACLEHAAAARMNDARIHYHLGTALLGAKQYERAVAVLRRADTLPPRDANTLTNLGNALAAVCQHEEAASCHRQLLAMQPDHVPAHFNLGCSLLALGRMAQAAACFRAARSHAPADIDPDRLFDVHASLAEALAGLGCFDEALATLRAVATVRPGAAAWNESLILLLLGCFEAGWRKFEDRWRVTGHDPLRADARVPRLAEVRGRRVLLTSEQGRGDIIQFARYAPLLARQGASVTLQTYAELRPLLRMLEGVAAVIEPGQPEPAYDIVTPLLSLPLMFGTTLASVPSDVPYLSASDDRVRQWRRRLGEARRLRIGIAWSGRAEHRHDAQRSMPLCRLVPLLRSPDVEFHSVQKDLRPADRDWLADNPLLRHHGEALHDFADAAALVSLMDLVLSVDTAAAHLAGALAKPVWIMLPRYAEWRWMLDRDDSPWYPTARLFRQQQAGDWGGVVSDVMKALARDAVTRLPA